MIGVIMSIAERIKQMVKRPFDDSESIKQDNDFARRMAQFMQMMNSQSNIVAEPNPPPPPPEPHDPFDLRFEVVERYLTGEIVLNVSHNCPDDTWKRELTQAWIPGPFAPGSALPYMPPPSVGGMVTSSVTAGPPGAVVANGHTVLNGHAVQLPLLTGGSPMAASAGNAAMQQYIGNGVSVPKRFLTSELGIIRLTLPDCPEFARITEAVECKLCKAVITGDIMRMAYFKHLMEKV